MPRAAEKHGQTLVQTLGYLLAGVANKYRLAWINVLFPLLQLLKCLVPQPFVMALNSCDLIPYYSTACELVGTVFDVRR